MAVKDFNEGELFIYKWKKNALGGFGKALLEVIAKADSGNQALLAKGFPVEVKAYQNYSCVDGWWQKVLEKAEKQR